MAAGHIDNLTRFLVSDKPEQLRLAVDGLRQSRHLEYPSAIPEFSMIKTHLSHGFRSHPA
jgi:hypothetical protein